MKPALAPENVRRACPSRDLLISVRMQRLLLRLTDEIAVLAASPHPSSAQVIPDAAYLLYKAKAVICNPSFKVGVLSAKRTIVRADLAADS